MYGFECYDSSTYIRDDFGTRVIWFNLVHSRAIGILNILWFIQIDQIVDRIGNRCCVQRRDRHQLPHTTSTNLLMIVVRGPASCLALHAAHWPSDQHFKRLKSVYFGPSSPAIWHML